MCFGVVQFKKVAVSPLGDGRETRRNIRKECGEFRKSRKNTEAKIVIRITHTVETSMRESIRKRGAVEVEKKRSKNGALRNTIKDRKRSGEGIANLNTLCTTRKERLEPGKGRTSDVKLGFEDVEKN